MVSLDPQASRAHRLALLCCLLPWSLWSLRAWARPWVGRAPWVGPAPARSRVAVPGSASRAQGGSVGAPRHHDDAWGILAVSSVGGGRGSVGAVGCGQGSRKDFL